ncbi:MAG: DUF4160 domain-containing protein [Alphaproteobacteria bacterium]
MPTIKDFGGFRLFMYFGDHNPPHIHIVGVDFEAKMRLSDQSLLAGTLSGKVERQAKDYVLSNLEDLMARWYEYNDQ